MSLLHLGTKVEEGDAEEIAKVIAIVLEAINKNHIDREVGIKALDVITQSFSSTVKRVNISNSTFTSEGEKE